MSHTFILQDPTPATHSGVCVWEFPNSSTRNARDSPNLKHANPAQHAAQ